MVLHTQNSTCQKNVKYFLNSLSNLKYLKLCSPEHEREIDGYRYVYMADYIVGQRECVIGASIERHTEQNLPAVILKHTPGAYNALAHVFTRAEAYDQ